MKNRKGYYLLMMAGILTFAFLVPVIIRAASGAFISRFAPAAVEAETEITDDRYRVNKNYQWYCIFSEIVLQSKHEMTGA